MYIPNIAIKFECNASVVFPRTCPKRRVMNQAKQIEDFSAVLWVVQPWTPNSLKETLDLPNINTQHLFWSSE
jgi:hypothetical protein